ncbi:hypothetical protein P5V15_008817 [Pogonomyrmex californicus]
MMEDHLDLQAPQWVDFTETSSPMRIQDFFEKTHPIHEAICIESKVQEDLDIIKSTPIKVVSPKHRNNKEVVDVAETTYDQVLNDAMRKLELCKKPSKTREALSKTIQESNVSKTSNTTKLTKSSRSVGYRGIPNKCIQSQRDFNVNAKIEKDNQALNKHSSTVLTWYNHRPSLQKRRISTANKKYVSLAEAVSRFQNETPQRFHTRSNKANTTKPLNISKSTQNRLKITVPISPALMSKNRTRPVTVLSQQEREILEMEEMKKHPIKANPIPPSVLRKSRIVTKTTGVVNNSIVATNTSSMTQSREKLCTTSSFKSKSPQLHRDKVGPKKVTKVLVTDPSGIIVKQEEVTFFGVPKDTSVTRNVTRVIPFSFEARNKNLQMKKEQRLKNLQEANKTKVEFHARPVPKFTRSLPSLITKQQSATTKQQNTKKFILPSPFSFDQRDKKLSEKKEQLVKQILDEDKRARVFRANPVPIFKPVMVRGRSKEKDKSTEMVNEQENKHEDQENMEPNVQKTENTGCTVDKQKITSLKNRPLLNTDKRAKERQEFNEKIRRKEMEEEAKRQEIEKEKLESEKVMKAELRKQAEIKARPMPVFKPPVVKTATKLLTNPQSPAFASKLKSKQT